MAMRVSSVALLLVASAIVVGCQSPAPLATPSPAPLATPSPAPLATPSPPPPATPSPPPPATPSPPSSTPTCGLTCIIFNVADRDVTVMVEINGEGAPATVAKAGLQTAVGLFNMQVAVVPVLQVTVTVATDAGVVVTEVFSSLQLTGILNCLTPLVLTTMVQQVGGYKCLVISVMSNVNPLIVKLN